MEAHVDLKFIILIVGFVVTITATIIGVGIAWGKHQRQLEEHQKAIDNCDQGNLMTIEKCKTFHDQTQEVTNVKLEGIQTTLDDMKKDRNKVDVTLGSLAVKLEVLMDRFERGAVQ